MLFVQLDASRDGWSRVLSSGLLSMPGRVSFAASWDTLSRETPSCEMPSLAPSCVGGWAQG